ncbi:TonB-dependent receptor [Occallatibacter riparius]|uniref:TonB-dependent receptor n=1 Tax=Occallatibacter riparius TaxID=1002689 RepID=A0A9J7BVF2_9BACT|nr:TonB-dependent receptor [Occallatibacter riparius]UWZ85762.1 TonB-dependent receptor [Occallatibacter riparius]
MNKMIRTALALALFACASLVLLAPARAQSVYGSIFGTVTDKSGAAIPNATVSVTSETKNTVVTVTSNASGDYSVAHLIPDVYDLKVEAQGFKTFQAKSIQVLADTSPRIDPTMDVGGASETVQVNADQEPILKTDRADVATVFDQHEVANLPVGDQNFTNLQLLVPGAQKLGWSHAASENPQASQQIMVNGQAFAGTAFELDGTDNQDPILGIIVINPTMDAVTETKITTQNFDAELGKAVSAVVTAQTKSGTNSFHGSVYDFRTSNANLARDPFTQPPDYINKAQGVPLSIPPGLKNRFGASIGGPIVKNRLFFFGNYEGQRQKVGTAQTDTLPTNLLTETALGNMVGPSGIPGADFSEYAAQLGDKGIIYQQFGFDKNGKPISKPYQGNVIPRAQLSQEALNFLKYLEPYTKGVNYQPGAGNVGNLDKNYSGSGTGTLNSDQWTVRGDYTINDKMHAFGRFSRFTDTLIGKVMFGTAGGPGFGLGGYGGTSQGSNDSLASGMDIALNQSLLTDWRFGYYRYNIKTHKPDQTAEFANTIGWVGMNTGDYYTGGSPAINFDTIPNGTTQPIFGDGLNVNRCNCPLTENEHQYQFVNNWTKIFGNHTAKIGADLRFANNLRVPSDNNRTGIVNFNAGQTSNPNNADLKKAQGGLGFASFLLGQVGGFQRYYSASTNAQEHQNRLFFYGQDTWRLTHSLTLNYGLRWELYFPETVNGKGLGSLLNLNDGYLHVAGYGNVGKDMGWAIEKKNMFAPRVGLNWQMNDRSVIRAGYGRSFDIGIFGSIFGHAATQNLPVLTNQNQNAPSTTEQAFNLAKGPDAPTTPAVPSSGLLPNPGAKVNSRARPDPLRFPMIDAWNLAYQRSITPTLSVTLAYVGNKGTYTLGDGSGNTINPNEAAIVLPASLGKNGQSLHWDPSGTSGAGATGNNNELRRYYWSSLPACRDANYEQPDPTLGPGACGWTNDITYYSDNLNTNFNAAQVTLQQNAWHGLNYTANYQWASAFADSTQYASWDRHAAHGRDSNVRRQQLTWFGTYDLPFGKGKMFASGVNTMADAFIGGWQLAGTVNVAGGLPFSLSYGESNNNIPGSAPNYPSYTSGARMKTSLTGAQAGTNGKITRTYYTAQTNNVTTDPGTGVFKDPGLDRIGDVKKNTYFGPGFWSSDLALAKTVTFHESIAAKFRFDAYNAFNHISPGNPGGSIESVGSINGGAPGYSPRQLEFSLRVLF